jgi:hypothetical protein
VEIHLKKPKPKQVNDFHKVNPEQSGQSDESMWGSTLEFAK